MLENLQVPDFEATLTSGKTLKLHQHAGLLVLYFYPKDNTPGCTDEGLQFRDLHAEFKAIGCDIIGVSRDSLRSHESFKAKMSFPFELLSDEDERVCQMFGVIKMKNMYGKQVRGIERSTFLIDGRHAVRREWRGVKVAGHAAQVLDAARSASAPRPTSTQ
ncbi:MAG: peroxiredoxin [Betaproteobacteria bacterium]|nr:peroxiredoxin [Betaproteobacteria bacterium]